MVLNMAIDKYVYVIVKERFDDKIYINYSRKEIVDCVDEIQHELVREALRLTGITGGVEITTLADIPSTGSGLGSSSAVTVGLLNAFYAYQGISVTAEQLAQESCHIEIDLLGKPIGKQDQYIAAYGNLRFIEFHEDDTVTVEPVQLSEARKRTLSSHLLLFFTGQTSRADTILSRQSRNIPKKLDILLEMKEQAYELRACLENDEPLSRVGEFLHQGWVRKKQLATGISNPRIDELYQRAREAGALGGKIAGAGGRGFLILYVPPERQEAVRAALSDLQEFPFDFSRDGSRIMLNVRR